MKYGFIEKGIKMKAKIEKSDLFTRQEKIYYRFAAIKIADHYIIHNCTYIKALIYLNWLKSTGSKVYKKPLIIGKQGFITKLV